MLRVGGRAAARITPALRDAKTPPHQNVAEY